MTDKLKCPFCEAELLGTLCSKYCPNEDCMCYSETISTSVWQALIDGKKAQEDLKYVKEELKCAKHNYSVLSEQKEIAYQNYLKITDDLQTQLQKAQDALKVAIDALSKIETFNCHGKGAMEVIAGMASIANGALYEITSITKQE